MCAPTSQPSTSALAVFVAQLSENRLAPYSEVFGLQRFRETELIHGRWAMCVLQPALIWTFSTRLSSRAAGACNMQQRLLHLLLTIAS
jgi:hypothetical protein